MDNGMMLTVQMGHGAHDGCNEGHDVVQRETLLGLSLAQDLQVWPINIIHEHECPVKSVIIEYPINMGEGGMIRLPGGHGLKEGLIAIFPPWLLHFSEDKELLVV